MTEGRREDEEHEDRGVVGMEKPIERRRL